MSGMRICRKVW